LYPMKKMVTPYKGSGSTKKEQVTKMFDGISKQYDVLNRVISLGIDQSWRRKVVRLAGENKPQRIIDVATGTGDLAIALKATGAKEIIGLDISPGMLSIGAEKVKKLALDQQINMVLGDGEKLPYSDNYFDVATVAFGVRNFEALEQGLAEIFRVLRPQGSLLVLETAVPTRFPFKQGYKIYSGWLVPFIGRLFSRDQNAYQYLTDSAAVFPHGEAWFIEVRDNPQTLGVASIYRATKP